MKRIMVVAAVLAFGSLAAAACGGSGAKPTASPAAVQSGTPGSTGTPGFGTQVPIGSPIAIVGSPHPTFTPTPFGGAQQTAIAQGSKVPLAEYKDPKGLFVVSLPVGWTIRPDLNGVAATLAGTPASADLGVLCDFGATVPGLIAADQSIVKQVGIGTMTLDKEFATTVAGVTAREIPWQGLYKDLNITLSHWYVYLQAKRCAWRLLLTTYPGANVDDMLVIFRRMLDSFRPL